MRTVLLVDDSPVARRALGRRLEAEGFDVRGEGSAQEALAADLGALACAVVDLQLGDGDGADLAARLLAKRPALPLAFFTATRSGALVEKARAWGPIFDKSNMKGLTAWVKRAAPAGQADQADQGGHPPPTK